MRFFKVISWLAYRIWFYLLISVPILVMSPLLLVSITREKWYPFFFSLARIWGKIILSGMGFLVTVQWKNKPKPGESYMFIANHTSMTDIMLMLSIFKNPFVFVGKKELVKIPVFGFFYKRTCIMVDRSSSSSRMAVYNRAQKRLNQGLSICIFPEGGVPEDESVVLAHFKDGAFKLAIEHKIPIVPVVLLDNKKRFSYTFFSGSPGRMRVKVLDFIDTTTYQIEDKAAVKELREKAYAMLYSELAQ